MTKLDNYIKLAYFAAKDPSLLPNHKPDVPKYLEAQLSEINEILPLIKEDPEFHNRMIRDKRSIKAALLVYQ